MLKNNKILILVAIFILFLSIGVGSASDIAEQSDCSDIVSNEDNVLLDNSFEENALMDNSVVDNSLSEDETSDISNDISTDAIKTDKISDGSKTFEKTKTKITAKKVNAYYKEKSYLNIYLRDSNNRALKNKAVKISINHKTYSKTTNNLGQVALKLNLKPNKYNVKISFDGDSDYYGSSLNTAVNVKKAQVSVKTFNSRSYFHPDTFFKAKVVNKITKKPMEGVNVLFKVYSSKNKFKNYYSLTNEKGIATLNKRLKSGIYDVYTYVKDKQVTSHKTKSVLRVMNTEEMGCSSVFVYLNENESAVSFRRDSTYGANLYVVAQKWHGRMAIKQYKLTGTYFFHAITTSDGWLIGNGGWDNPTVNKKIENLAGKIVSSNKMKASLLKSILSQERRLNTGHLAIVAPDGRYAVVWRSGYIKGKLKSGEYLVVPNVRSLFRHGKYNDYSISVPKASLKIAATDIFGINRRNIMTYHYKRSTKDFKTSATVKIYGSNDKGNLLGRHTAGLIDNVYLKKKFISKLNLFGTPNQKLLGTHKFGNIDKLIKTQTRLNVKNITSDFNKSSYFKLKLTDKKTKKALNKVKINLRIFTGKTYVDYIVKTDQNGNAKFNTAVLSPGIHNVSIRTANNKYIISGKGSILIKGTDLNSSENSTLNS